MKKKTTWVFLYIKYSKFWSVSLEHFVERKPLISEEWQIDTWKSSEFHKTNFTLEIIMFDHKMLPPFEKSRQICWTFWTRNPFWFYHIFVAVENMIFQNWSKNWCGTLWTIHIISLIQMNTFHFGILFLILFSGEEIKQKWTWIDWIFSIYQQQLGMYLVTLKIKYSFRLKQSEIYWKSQNFHNSYCILNPILNTIGTLVAKITQIANFFRKKPNFNKLSTMFQW